MGAPVRDRPSVTGRPWPAVRDRPSVTGRPWPKGREYTAGARQPAASTRGGDSARPLVVRH